MYHMSKRYVTHILYSNAVASYPFWKPITWIVCERKTNGQLAVAARDISLRYQHFKHNFISPWIPLAGIPLLVISTFSQQDTWKLTSSQPESFVAEIFFDLYTTYIWQICQKHCKDKSKYTFLVSANWAYPYNFTLDSMLSYRATLICFFKENYDKTTVKPLI